MSRPKLLQDDMVVSVRMEKEIYYLIREIASVESMNTGKYFTVQDLIRNALTFVYSDNERLRECFRRSRAHMVKRYL